MYLHRCRAGRFQLSTSSYEDDRSVYSIAQKLEASKRKYIPEEAQVEIQKGVTTVEDLK